MSEIEIDFLIHHQGWKDIRGLKKHLLRAAKALYPRLPKSFQKPLTVTLLLTSNDEIKRLNHTFRGQAKATNVLSFPSQQTGKKKGQKGNTEALSDGDIALAYQYIVAEAKHDRKMLISHTCHLLVHGILHILGYDHTTPVEAFRMERLETRVMADLGYADPYAEELKE